MHKTLLSLFITANLLLVVACQPRSEVETAPENADTPAVTAVKAAPEPLVVANQVTDGSLEAQTCLDLNDTMQKVDETSPIEAINEVQKQLKVCLPTANNQEVLTLLKSYQAMYGRFLATNNYSDDDVFFDISESLENGIKVPSKQLNSLSSRNQYLVRLIEGGDDISLLYIGEGIFVFHHDLQAMAAIFTPYLPKDQTAFIQRMAEDNQDIFWNDAAVAVPFAEVIDRAVFWENYIKQYPKSYFIKDAKQLFKLYRYVLFFGSDNTDWTDDLYREFYDPAYKSLMINLSQRPNSLLAKDAKTLLEFMAMADSERQQRYPTDTQGSDIEEDPDNEWAAWSTASEQLDQALPMTSPWQDNNEGYRDCLSSVICVDYDY